MTPRTAPEFDVSNPHPARVYDFLIGGRDNYAADRAAAEALLKIAPGAACSAQANRAFLGRAVRYLAAEAGIRQFLDIGTGIPAPGSTHEVAQAAAPESRVVYADHDPIVLAHARALLTSGEGGATAYIDADLRDTGTILSGAAELLDFTKPVAVTLLSILHAIPDADDPHAIVARVMAAVPPGSYLTLSHVGSELLNQRKQDEVRGIADRMVQQTPTYRSQEQIARFFAGCDLVDPGIVRVEQWRPEPGTGEREASSMWCAVGRRRFAPAR